MIRRGLLAALLLAGCGAPVDETPTFEVELRPFLHQVTAEGNLKAAEVTRVTVPPEVQSRVRLAWLAPEGEVEAGDVVARFDAGEMEDRLHEGRLMYRNASLEVDKTQAQNVNKASGYQTKLELAELDLAHARRFQKTEVGLYSRQEVVSSQIDETLATERREHAQASKATQETLGKTDLELLEIRQRQAQLSIDQAATALQALEVEAPHPGLLTWVRNWRGEPPQIGDQMWSGQPIAELPDLDIMEAEVYVLEADAGGLEPGKTALVVVEAHPEVVHTAIVERVDAVAKPRFRGSPVQYFGVTLRFEEPERLPAKPGHRVLATLVIEELDDALVVPRQAVFEDDGEQRVWVENGEGFEARAIEIEAASMGLVVITAGLEAGDIVALRRPAATMDTETPASGSQGT